MTKINEVLNNYLTGNSLAENDLKYNAAANIKALLNTVDLSVEVVPEKNQDMFERLISSLKGKPLSIEETEIINDITR